MKKTKTFFCQLSNMRKDFKIIKHKSFCLEVNLHVCHDDSRSAVTEVSLAYATGFKDVSTGGVNYGYE
jgi:hypothetical protein